MTRGTLPFGLARRAASFFSFPHKFVDELAGKPRPNIGPLGCQKSGRLCVNPNRPESSIFTGLNPLQPKPAFSSLDHVPLAPAAEFWAVRSGPPVSEALARSAGLQVSALRASADRCAVVCDFLDLTFCFSFTGLCVVGKLLQSGLTLDLGV
jgi:hypothetical protein